MISYVEIEAHMQDNGQLERIIDQALYSTNPSTGLPYAAGFAQLSDGSGFRTWAMVPPTGTITLYGGTSAPTGWLRCDGSTTSLRSAYPALYAVIGTTYGTATDTTFKLPGPTQLPTTPLGFYIIKF
jgi:hypothetical protein